MQINEYALRTKDRNDLQLGYVQRGCGVTVEEANMLPTFDSVEKMIEIKSVSLSLLTGGIYFQVILICLGTALLLQRWMPVIVDYSLQSTKMYSMLWAVVTTAGIFWSVSMAVNTFSIVTMYRQGHDEIATASSVAIYIPAVLEFPIAVKFTRKCNFPIPCIYLAPVKLLCCCGKKSKASLVVRVLSLWVVLTAIQLACVNGTFIVIATAAAPFPVISNVLAIIFTMFCLVHLFAIILAMPHPHRQESGSNRNGRKQLGVAVLQGITFLFLLVTLLSFVMAGAGFSYIINIQSNHEATLYLGNAVIPIALGITGFALRRLNNMWWSAYGPVSTENEMVHGLINGTNGYEAV